MKNKTGLDLSWIGCIASIINLSSSIDGLEQLHR